MDGELRVVGVEQEERAQLRHGHVELSGEAQRLVLARPDGQPQEVRELVGELICVHANRLHACNYSVRANVADPLGPAPQGYPLA